MRLAAKAKMGFYPCPEPVVSLIAKRLTVSAEAVLLDPCAGRGAAVRQLADEVGLPTSQVCASELDGTRSLELAEALPEGIVSGNTDFLSAKFNGRPSLVYCNPPFDSELGGGGRVETRFLSQVLHSMEIGGVLVFIGPEHLRQNSDFLRLLTGYIGELTEAPFPRSERRFRESVWLGYRRKEYEERGLWPYRHDSIEEMPKYEVCRGRMPTVFTPRAYSDDLLCKAVNASGAVDSLNKMVRQPKDLRPPLKLGKGHLALLLAGGHLNGVVEKEGRPPHVVRGTATKEEYEKSKETTTSEKTTTTKIVMSEQICLTVRYVDASGVIQTVKDQIAQTDREETEETASAESD